MSGGGNGHYYGVIYYEQTWGDMDCWFFEDEKEAREAVAELEEKKQSYLLIMPGLTVDKLQKMPGTFTQAELDQALNQEAMASKYAGRQEALHEAHELWSTVEHYRADIPEQVLKRLDKFKAYCEQEK